MTENEVLETVRKALDAIKNLPEHARLTISFWDRHWNIELDAHVFEESNHHKTIALCTPFVGKLSLDEDLGWWRGNRDNVSVNVIKNKPCSIVGYKIEKKPVMKQIETGDFEERRIAITDCDIRKGVFSESDIEVLV